MVNIIGPGGPGINETETRPAPAATGAPNDTWFQNCSSPSANDGTKVAAEWLNILIAQLRVAIRGMGVAEDELDDQMLLKAIQAAEAAPVTFHDLTAGEGLNGGGNMGADVTVNLNIPELTALMAVDPAADVVALYDISAGAHRKVKVQDLATAANYFTLTAGEGLSGGGNLGADVTVNLSISELTALGAADPDADYLAIYDGSGGSHRKVLPKDLGLLQTYFTLTAGEGLSGGGNLGADVTVNLSISELTALGAADPDADYLALYDTSGGNHRKVKPSGLGIGGYTSSVHGSWNGESSVFVGAGNAGRQYVAWAGSGTSSSEDGIRFGSGTGTVSGSGQVTLTVAGGTVVNAGRYVVLLK